MLLKTVNAILAWVKALPIIRNIPGFNTLPEGITSANLRFYKLSNLVLTLGMAIHSTWIWLFLLMDVPEMALINVVSVLVYIFCIVINRYGYHFTSSVIMVVEILVHQLYAVKSFGWDAGFQNYVIVIGLFPFLMPKGRWIMKSILLGACICTYIILDYTSQNQQAIHQIGPAFLNYLKITNILFSYTSMAISGGYFNIAMHETEGRLRRKTNELLEEKNKSDELLLNILPQETAQELKETGSSKPKSFEMVTVIFTDFKNFTQYSEKLSAEALVHEINYYYSAFDRIITKHRIEKIKTIGDGYMCVGGLPTANETNPKDAVMAALELRDFIASERTERGKNQELFFDVRIGIHTGPVVSGIVGIKKFAYDIWGDTVNTASRMESSGEAGEINISGTTYDLVKDSFNCTYRGKIEAKNKGEIDMYFVEGLK